MAHQNALLSQIKDILKHDHCPPIDYGRTKDFCPPSDYDGEGMFAINPPGSCSGVSCSGCGSGSETHLRCCENRFHTRCSALVPAL